MDIDALITLLGTYKRLGGRRVLLSLDDEKPPEQPIVTLTPIGDVVYIRSATELMERLAERNTQQREDLEAYNEDSTIT